MQEELIRKHRWFWAWADDREEAWLREMAQQGLHLGKAAPLGEYFFVRGEPRDDVYRLDYVPMSKKDEHYYQLFKDAGWEHVGEMMGWQYWRKLATDSQADEIFTDNDSKIQKYQRLLAILTIFLPVLIINVTNMGVFSLREKYPWIIGLQVFSIFLLVFYSVVLLRILFRIRMLRRR
ncbi:MAG: DUF2812 domain-containing protein [Anaerolineales bacterium]|nr:DUF2812 domain-containing protein [Anaerolineales bacterium]